MEHGNAHSTSIAALCFLLQHLNAGFPVRFTGVMTKSCWLFSSQVHSKRDLCRVRLFDERFEHVSVMRLYAVVKDIPWPSAHRSFVL